MLSVRVPDRHGHTTGALVEPGAVRCPWWDTRSLRIAMNLARQVRKHPASTTVVIVWRTAADDLVESVQISK
jgi:hypothetical protein